MVLAVAVIILAIMTLSNTVLAQPTYVQERTRSIGEQIVGTWKLDSIYEEDAGGEEIDQFGVAPTGLFMADRNGNFSFQIVSIDGRRYVAKGQLLVGKRHHKLTLHVEYCLFRSCDNTNRTAELKIVGDTMELISTVDTSLTGASYSHTVWKRGCCK